MTDVRLVGPLAFDPGNPETTWVAGLIKAVREQRATIVVHTSDLDCPRRDAIKQCPPGAETSSVTTHPSRQPGCDGDPAHDIYVVGEDHSTVVAAPDPVPRHAGDKDARTAGHRGGLRKEDT